MKTIILVLVFSFAVLYSNVFADSLNPIQKLKYDRANLITSKYGCKVEEVLLHYGTYVPAEFIIAGILQEDSMHKNEIMPPWALGEFIKTFPGVKINTRDNQDSIKIAVLYYSNLMLRHINPADVGYYFYVKDTRKEKNPFENRYVHGIYKWLEYMPTVICSSKK